MSKTTKRLGRGLESLVSDLRTGLSPGPIGEGDATGPPSGDDRAGPVTGRSPASHHGDTSGPTAMRVPVDGLRPNPFQPRQVASAEGLASLAESLRTCGMIQPITVRRVAGELEIITGERRWRAAKLGGLGHVPVLVRQADDRQMLEMALIENIQREDLNAVDRARAYREYGERFELTAEAVASRLGEDRTTVTNYLRLLDLDEPILGMVADGRMNMGHARCIVGERDEEVRLRLAEAVVGHDLSVRALEEIVRRGKNVRGRGGADKRPETDTKSAHLRDLEDRLSVSAGTKVTIQEGKRKGTGRVVIEYYSLDDFDRIAEMLGERPSEK